MGMVKKIKSREKKREKVQDICGLLGILWAFGYAVITNITFFLAYFTEAKAIIVYINRLGEANIEFPMNIIAMCFWIWGIYWFIHEAILEKGEEEVW